jgi:pyridoxamine 5'-phosphate oxidase
MANNRGVGHPRDARATPLHEADVDPDPIRQFQAWFEEAKRTTITLPEAMTLATATADAVPSARLVLLKRVDQDGFVFFTNHGSRKARELSENPRAALVLYWDPLGRQVRVEGRVERVPEDESAAYFATRPRAARLSAWASKQSEPVEGRGVLEAEVARLAGEFGDDDIPLPPFWGGYRVVPDLVEFWQHREDRLHDRLRYRREAGGGWVVERLSP